MKRLSQLDGLRGLAALQVFMNHVQDVTPRVWYYFDLTPLRIIATGHAAVILFFVLSGFVLALPMISAKTSYSEFIIRRFFRIYIPYVLCVLAAFACLVFLHKINLQNLSDWTNSFSTTSFSWALFTDYLLVFHNFSIPINTVIWTLVIELRIALIFPVLFLAIYKLPIKYLIPFMLFLALISLLAQINAGQNSGDYFETVHYIVFFALGIVLAIYKDQLIWGFNNLPFKKLLFGVSLLVYAYGSMIRYFMQHVESVAYITQTIADFSIAAGVVFILISLLARENRFRILESGVLRFLGNISYSFYLYHAIIIITLLNLFYSNIWSLFIILPASLLVSLLVSFLLHRFVEVPSNNLGRKISNGFSSKLRPPIRYLHAPGV